MIHKMFAVVIFFRKGILIVKRPPRVVRISNISSLFYGYISQTPVWTENVCRYRTVVRNSHYRAV